METPLEQNGLGNLDLTIIEFTSDLHGRYKRQERPTKDN